MKNKIYLTSIIIAFVLNISPIYAQVPCPAPGTLASSNITSNSATVSWTAVSNNVFYNVRYRISPNTSWLATITTQIPNANLSNLNCLSAYEWQVQTGCASGTGTIILSSFSNSAFFTTLSCAGSICGIPTGLYSNNNAPTSISLHWNSTGATTYKVRYRLNGTTAWTTTGTGTTTKNLTGLIPLSVYQWQVRSRCVDAITGVITYSAWSSTSLFQTTGATTCATPTGLTASSNGTNSILLAWNPSGATSYNIRYKPANSTAWITTTSNTASKSLTGLLSLTVYEWQVQGVCAANGVITLSAWSSSSFFTTNNPVSISPNPVKEEITIEFESVSPQHVSISIRDFFGTSLSEINAAAIPGSNQYKLNTNNLKNGIYYVELAGSEGRQTHKFYVQH